MVIALLQAAAAHQLLAERESGEFEGLAITFKALAEAEPVEIAGDKTDAGMAMVKKELDGLKGAVFVVDQHLGKGVAGDLGVDQNSGDLE